MFPQRFSGGPVLGQLISLMAKLPVPGPLGATYVPGITSLVQGDMALLDSEIPAVNAVVTARGLAKMYGALANGGSIDGQRFLSEELVASLTGRRSLRPDLNVFFPMSFHLGYHGSPVPGLLRGFGHAGLGGTIGWADPITNSSFAFVHNRLLTPMVADQLLFVPLLIPIQRAVTAAHARGFVAVPRFGARPADEARTETASR